MSKIEAARLFGVSLSSVKRYSEWPIRGTRWLRRSLGRTPRADEKVKQLLNGHMKERTAATIAERIGFLQGFTGERLSYSTIRRLFATPGMEQ